MAVDRETLLQQPAMAPPPGIQANFDDPYNLRSSSLARNVSIMIISNLAVWMRLFTKFKIVRKLHVEDCKTLRLSK
ncbi:hypothetical protein K491DRAFT_599588 [Lophiostoma macrostomum CBS 122681]|uniref:Uncharacterized protein n=1 Tax=Lophiostoma macrostomum CBS 122681 TaxID=1314788 RepID=A0A6A6T833_9PLEO|nr:hypothetical protein K491DRAFT_599588 [Lophiostoma macrostomum CBS 122681]